MYIYEDIFQQFANDMETWGWRPACLPPVWLRKFDMHQVLFVDCVCRWFSFGFAFDVLFLGGFLHKSQRTIRNFNMIRTRWSHQIVPSNSFVGCVCRWFSFGFAFDVLFRSLSFSFFFFFLSFAFASCFFFLFFFCGFSYIYWHSPQKSANSSRL